jgi:anaerobic magnesium-protoporphyrin IX monomethyl ester cyclase
MSDVLLAQAPIDSDIPTWQSMSYKPCEHLGLLYICGTLRLAGLSCEVIDVIQEERSVDEFTREIIASLPSLFIGFSVGPWNLKTSLESIRLLRQEGIDTHITMGGIWPSLKVQALLETIPELNSIVVGEGEQTAVDLAGAIRGKKDWALIPGVASRSSNGHFSLRWRKLLDDIDSLPVPDRRCYVDTLRVSQTSGIIFNRGCSGRCTFCELGEYRTLCGGLRRRSRDPASVVDEMESVSKQIKVRSFQFFDDDFLGVTKKDQQRCMVLARGIIKRGLDIGFAITSQARGFNAELLHLLKDAGLERVFIGIESWTDSQLRRYGKLSTRQDNLRAIEILGRLGIPFKLFMIPLDPYVTRAELKTTLRETECIGLDSTDDLMFSKRMTLYENSRMFKSCKRDGLVLDYGPLAYDVPYRQKNQDVVEIARASEEIKRLFSQIMSRFQDTGKRKELPETWYVFYNDVRLALKRKLFRDFKEFVENVDPYEDGKKYIESRMSDIDKRISAICSTVSRDKLERFNGLTIFIDREEISTRLKETFKVSVKNNFWVI